ncbi:ATP-binding cassette sub-family B member 6 [Echinococcus granulosus]|uniref:ATP-binding cassette sub-family B member 6 n=1 Tax=Echinococcus granulosus TaxID=6210 RepID=W6UQL0_ECHGR|nr:ATP-binding cassette sub-family B member 6 [Echinococcus granulosus]EUB60602.1 ATP-binding cassette sub-family B member 6 [Echinococcus granulosus]
MVYKAHSSILRFIVGDVAMHDAVNDPVTGQDGTNRQSGYALLLHFSLPRPCIRSSQLIRLLNRGLGVAADPAFFGFVVMQYCPPNETLLHPWHNGGLNRCFLWTLSSSLSLSLSFLALITYVSCLCCNSRRSENRTRSVGFGLQVTFSALLIFITLAHAFVYMNFKELSGFAVLYAIGMPIAWIIAMSLLIIERQRTCPRLYGMRHGFPLLLFWTISFVLVNLPLTCIGSSSWWWKLETDLDKAELAVWIAEYMCTLLVFILGLLAPGSPNYAMLYHGLLDENAVTQDPLAAGRWGVFKRRASVLFPFIWPRSRYLLQLNIILCVCILVVARVVNLYVPIFYKNIVNSLTPNVTTNQSMDFVVQQMRSGDFSYLYMTMVGPSGLVFRWDLILYYIGIRAVQGVGSPSSGLLGALQAQLWISVDQNSARMLGVHLFKHLHGHRDVANCTALVHRSGED